MQIRKMALEDVSEVALIEQACFSLPWSEKSFKESLELPETAFFVADDDERILGYMGCYMVDEVGEITNVAVREDARNKKIASSLIDSMTEEAKQRGLISLLLEVRESNDPAIKLYQKKGFYKIGIRKNFYEKPKEHAIIMQKDL